MDGKSLDVWKKYFIRMAEGKIAPSSFYVVTDNDSHESDDAKVSPILKITTTTQEAVATAKAEMSENSIRGGSGGKKEKSWQTLNRRSVNPPPGKRKAESSNIIERKRKKTIWN
jgi:hypothetical protein